MAQIRGSARRYAAAVFEIARDSNSVQLWESELARLSEVFLSPNAATVLVSPSVSDSERRLALEQLVPNLSAPLQAFLDILIARRRLDLIPEILQDFRRRLDEFQGVAVVEVTTAVPMDAPTERLLTERLSGYTGKQVRIDAHVDPEILGGVVARIGDELLDDSVRGRLVRLRRRLSTGTDRA